MLLFIVCDVYVKGMCHGPGVGVKEKLRGWFVGSKDHTLVIRLAQPAVFNYWAISLAIIFKKKNGAGEMAEWATAAIVLTEDLHLFPSTHRAAHNCLELQLSTASDAPFWHPRIPGTLHMKYIAESGVPSMHKAISFISNTRTKRKREQNPPKRKSFREHRKTSKQTLNPRRIKIL